MQIKMYFFVYGPLGIKNLFVFIFVLNPKNFYLIMHNKPEINFIWEIILGLNKTYISNNWVIKSQIKFFFKNMEFMIFMWLLTSSMIFFLFLMRLKNKFFIPIVCWCNFKRNKNGFLEYLVIISNIRLPSRLLALKRRKN